MVVKDYLTLGSRHTMKYIDHVSQKCTFETIISLTNIIPIHLT